jgi:anti-anti-sigma regulatory factor
MNHTRADHSLSISQRPLGPMALLVRLGGELTSASACALATWVEQVCGGHVRAIHADVRRLDYIDDAGAWTLALAFQCLRFHGNPVQIYNAPFALRCVLDVVCAHGTPGGAPSAILPGRSEHESLAAGIPPLGWLAMDLLICNEDPQLSSMFAIFDQLSRGQGPPAKATLSQRKRTRGRHL